MTEPREYIVPLSEDEAFYGFKDVAVPLIRCKDCKWYGDGYLCYNTETLGMKPDDYCSLAERKDG